MKISATDREGFSAKNNNVRRTRKESDDAIFHKYGTSTTRMQTCKFCLQRNCDIVSRSPGIALMPVSRYLQQQDRTLEGTRTVQPRCTICKRELLSFQQGYCDISLFLPGSRSSHLRTSFCSVVFLCQIIISSCQKRLTSISFLLFDITCQNCVWSQVCWSSKEDGKSRLAKRTTSRREQFSSQLELLKKSEECHGQGYAKTFLVLTNILVCMLRNETKAACLENITSGECLANIYIEVP